MKQEASKKSKLWLWLVIGVVALLAVAGVVLALVLGSGNNEPAGPTGGRPELYWNIDKKAYTENSQSGLSTREPGEDGLYHVRFAVGGEIVELPVVDKQLINYIDTLDAMGLVKDADGTVVDVKDPKDIAAEVGKNIYVKGVEGGKIIANSSLAMNGMPIIIEICDLTEIYDVTSGAEVPGQIIDPAQLKAMDTITIYANDLGENTHVYVTDHAKESKVYWRASQSWNSKLKETSREPDENGVYSMDFFCEGELVTLKTKDKTIATKVDSISRYSCHFGFGFDEEGYITEYFSSALGIGGMLACERWDVVSIEGDYVTINRLLTNDGSTWSGTVSADCVIYDVSPAAVSEGRQGKQVESLSVGDRVCVWTDTNGNPVLVYVSMHMVDSPAYWIPTNKYSSKTKETTREPNARGYYEVELLREGDNKKTTYYIKDKETMSYLDSQTTKCVGLKVGEGNVVEYVYDSECLTGYSCATRGGVVTTVAGSVFTKITYGQPGTEVNYILAADARVYNTSTYGEYGEKTTLMPGDHIYGYRQPTGELKLVFITKRRVGGDSLYYNLERLYDSTNKVTKREPDENGWYVFTLAHNGKQVTLKTKNKELASKVDAYDPCAMVLEVSGDIILAAHDPTYAYSGSKVASGYRYVNTDAEGTVNTYYKNGDTYKEVSFKMADNCKIYNVSPVFDNFKGEQVYSIRYDDMITAYTNGYGEAEVIFIRGRKVDNMYWKTEQLYDSTNKVTKRVPDADGWYYYDLAVNGECKTFKTNDIKIANSMDSYAGAFGLHVDGDVIKAFVTVGNVRNVTGNGVISWDVTAIDGNKVTLKYNNPGSSNGKTQTITLASDAKIYDVSPTAESFGKAVKLQVGDRIRTYINQNDKHQYVYVQFHATRKGGSEGYCEHCDKNVFWNPWAGGAVSYADGHYYLVGDCVTTTQTNVGSESKDYSVCIDLNGHTLTREAEGRFALVRYGDTLNIMDSVGGGKIQAPGGNATGTGYNGGVMMIGTGAKVNMYSGTLEMLHIEGIENGYGGVVYMSGKECVFNMYGGEITGGTSYAQTADKPGSGGNVYVSAGTFNMYGGTVSDGESYGGIIDVTDSEGKTTVKRVYGYGGNFYIASGAKVNITGGTVTGGAAIKGTRVEKDADGNEVVTSSGGYGGNIYCSSTSGVLNVTNATITGGEATRGGNIYGTGTNTFTGATISNGTAWQHGGNIHTTNGTWLFNGGTKVIDGTSGCEDYHGHGGNISVYGGTVTVEKATVDGGRAGGLVNGLGGSHSGQGGNIYLYQNAATDVIVNICDGAVISDGIAADHGGNIYQGGSKKVTEKVDGEEVDVYYVPVLNISGGQIINGVCDGRAGAAAYGGNIYVGGDLNLSGGTISGGLQNTTPYDIYVTGAQGDVVISGGKVADKLRVYQANSFTLSGTPELGQLNLHTITKVDLGEMKDGADVSVIANGVFTNPSDNAQAYVDAQYIKAYDSTKQVEVTTEKELSIAAAPAPTQVAPCYCKEHNGADVTWTLWTADAGIKGAIPSGHYYMDSDVDLTTNYYIGDSASDSTVTDVVLDLRGHTIQSTKRAFYMFKNDKLSIMDTVGGGAVKGALTSVAGGVIYVGDGGDGSFDLYSGSIIDVSTVTREVTGGAVQVAGKSTFTMHGGVVTGLSASKGGAIYTSSGTVTIKAGTINGGDANGEGDCIYVGTGTLDIQGGTINGQILSGESATVKLSGEPVVTELDLSNGTLVQLGELAGNASVTVKASGIFTEESTKANDCIGFFHSADTTKYISAVASGSSAVLAVTDEPGGTVEIFDPNAVHEDAAAMDFSNADPTTGVVVADCPACGAENVEWKPLTVDEAANTKLEGTYHYYLADHLTTTKRFDIGADNVAATACIHLNGKNLTRESERVFYVPKLSVLNLMGEGIVSGSFVAAKTHYASTIDVTGILNLYGGTYQHASARPIISARGTNASYECAINIYDGAKLQGDASLSAPNIYLYDKGTLQMAGGVIENGNAEKGGNVYAAAGGYTSVTISGGTISGGEVYLEADSAITLSGDPVISNLNLTSGLLATVEELTGDASITVTADGKFANAADAAAAEAAAGYFHSADSALVIKVEGSALSVKLDNDPNEICAEANAMDFSNADADGKVTAKCPACGTDAEWLPLPAIKSSNFTRTDGAHYHYYLSEDTDYTQNAKHYLVGGSSTMCLHLNGQTMVSSENSRALIVDGRNATMNIMGDGTVRASSTGAINRGVLDTTGEMNLYGGTYECTSADSPVVAVRGSSVYSVLNVYEGTTIQRTADGTAGLCVYVFDASTMNLYGGTVSGGNTADNDTINGGCIYLKANTGAQSDSRNCAVNIYGGTITGGVDTLRGNIYVEGNSVATNSATVTVSGGVVSNGSIYATGENANVILTGTPVIGELDVSGGVLATVEELSEGADITVNAADGVVFTNPIAQNAETYAVYFHTEDMYMGAVVTAQNALAIGKICPHCNTAWDACNWQSITLAPAMVINTSGHYYLESDYIQTSGTQVVVGTKAATGANDVDVVVDLRGNTYETNARCFLVYDKLAVLDSVGGAIMHSTTTMGGGALYVHDGTISMYGGTASCTTAANGGAAYNLCGIFNLYGGTLNGGTLGSGKCGGALYSAGGTVNVYGGTVNGGDAPGGGDSIYVADYQTSHDGRLNLFGGTVNGQLLVAADAEVSVSGAPVVTDLELGANVKAELGKLTEGADITVTAEGVFTAANENAQAYVDAQYIKAADGKVISVNTDNTLSMAAATTLQLLAKVFNLLCASII